MGRSAVPLGIGVFLFFIGVDVVKGRDVGVGVNVDVSCGMNVAVSKGATVSLGSGADVINGVAVSGTSIVGVEYVPHKGGVV